MPKSVQFSVPRTTNPLQMYSFPQGFAGGMNISVSGDQIAPNQSPSIQDVNFDDGSVISKRRGLARVTATSWGTTPIRGMHEFWKIGATSPIFLIAWGGKLYSYNESTDAKTDLCTATVLTFTDAPVSFFDMGNKCYFFTGNEFLYYDGTNPVATVESIAYVPLKVINKVAAGTGGSANEKLNHLSQKWKEGFNPDGTATVFQCDKLDGVTLSTNLFKAYLSGVEKTEGTDFTVDRTAWTFTFSTAPPSSIYSNTLELQLEATNLTDATVITKCARAIEFGGKNNSVVCVTGNPSFPNTIYYSWIYDPTYWPVNSDFNVGGDSRAINGWGRMNEYLISYKEPGDQTSQWYSSIDLDATGNISFSTYQLNDEFGCIAPLSVRPAQNGLLALSDKGVVWTWPSLVKGQANCKIVSHNINGKNGIASGLLDNTDADLKAAFAEVRGNKYLLHVGSQVWVLDLDYSDLGQNVYCWYPYAGLYASAGSFLERSDRLYIGDKVNGLIYKEQLPGDTTEYADDGLAIDAWWTSPLMFLGGREYIKKFERINMTFKASHGTTHTLYLISDSGPEKVSLRQEAGNFDARYFNAEYFNAGSLAPDYPNSQGEKIGIKAEYMQIKLENNMFNRGMTILALTISFMITKIVK